MFLVVDTCTRGSVRVAGNTSAPRRGCRVL